MIPFDTEEEAIRLENDIDGGLAYGIWTQDVCRSHRVICRPVVRECSNEFNRYFATDTGVRVRNDKLFFYSSIKMHLSKIFF